MAVSYVTTNKVRHVGDGVTTSFPFSFPVLQTSDLKIYPITRSTGAVGAALTMGSHYTVALSTSEGGTVTATPAPANTIDWVLINEPTGTQPLTFETIQSFPAVSLNEGLNRAHLLIIKLHEMIKRAPKFTLGSTASEASMPVTPTDGKSLKWSSGNLINSTYDPDEVVALATIEKDAAVAAKLAAETAQGAAETAEQNAETAEQASEDARDIAQEWATKTDDLVENIDNSAKAWAIGGTGDGQPEDGDAKSWAIKTSAEVDGDEFSAKEYAQGDQAGTGGSSKNWAQLVGAAVTGALYSAKEWAVGTFTRGAAGGGSAKDWANYTGGTVDDTEYSAKKYAEDAAQSATDAEAIANLPIDTKGDLLVHTATGLAKQAIGSNDQVLIADSSQTNGLKWGTNTPADNTVSTAKIIDANVTRTKLAAGAVGTKVVAASQTAGFTAAVTTDYYPCNAAGGAFTVTLPTGVTGAEIMFHKTDSSVNAVTLGAITGMHTQNEKVRLMYNGSAWIVSSREIPKTWTTFTPTGAWTGGNVTYTGKWRRIGNYMQIETKIALTGAPTGTQLHINMPTGYVIDTMLDATVGYGAMPSSNASSIDASSNGHVAIVAYRDTGSVQIMSAIQGGSAAGAPIYTGNNVTQLIPITFGNGDGVIASWSAPIVGWNG